MSPHDRANYNVEHKVAEFYAWKGRPPQDSLRTAWERTRDRHRTHVRLKIQRARNRH